MNSITIILALQGSFCTAMAYAAFKVISLLTKQEAAAALRTIFESGHDPLRSIHVMSNQMLLPGFELPPRPTIKLFLAVMPETPTVGHIHGYANALCRMHTLQGMPLPASQLHISLFGLGIHTKPPRNLLAAVNTAISRFNQQAFRVRFDHVQTFRNKSRISGGYPVVLCGTEGVIGLEALYHGLLNTLDTINLKGWPSGITPHVTLLYDCQGIPAQAIEPIEWDVRDFVLLCRHIGQKRPYTVLKKWTLQDSRHSSGLLN